MIVGIAGKRGSGKTSLARILEANHGYTFASFGNIVRLEAHARGLGSDLSTLQQLGATLISEWGWQRFCAATLAGAPRDRPVAVEGVRHRGAVEGLRELADGHFLLVFVTLADDVRSSRLYLRRAPGESGLPADAGITEQEVEYLRSLSDVVVDGSDLEEAARQVEALVAAMQSRRN